MPKVKSNVVKIRCNTCEKVTGQRYMMNYVCVNGHRDPVHYNCREFYQRCKKCGEKINATAQGNWSNPKRDIASYRMYHVSNLKRQIVNSDTIGRRVVKQNLAYASPHRRGDVYFKEDGVSQEAFDKAMAAAKEEAEAEWAIESKKISEWFAQ